MPQNSTVEDIEELHMLSWELGLKAVAIYRDGSKVAQPLSSKKDDEKKDDLSAHKAETPEQITEALVAMTPKVRREIPRVRTSKTMDFKVAGTKGYITVGEFEDGTPGELWLKIAKQGSTLAGVMDALAISVSYGLQYGVPLKSYVHALTNMSFAPAGLTDDPEVKTATSIVDYIFKRLAKQYLGLDDQLELGLINLEDLEADALDKQANLLDTSSVESSVQSQIMTAPVEIPKAEFTKAPGTADVAPLCDNCGNQTQRAGSCYVCTACGTTSGCS
jgi:ribonucleoside-diphosphate reductase alpha chain